MNKILSLVATVQRPFPLRFVLAVLTTAISFAVRAPAATAAQSTTGLNNEWPMFNGGYDGARYSELREITPANVNKLEVVGRYQLPETTSFQTGIVAVDGTLFFTTVNTTYAIDARSGKLRWSHTEVPKSQGIGTPVRGVAYAGGRLFRGTMDARLMALDAATGKVL